MRYLFKWIFSILAMMLFTATVLITAQQPQGAGRGQGQAPGQGGAPPGGATPGNYANLQVLPRDITVQQMMLVMRGFQADLGVTCDHCHVFFGLGDPRTDLPSDEKQAKRTARLMMVAARDFNARLTPANLGRQTANVTTVMCGTCHRGKPIPEYVQPPLQPPLGGPRGGGPAGQGRGAQAN